MTNCGLSYKPAFPLGFRWLGGAAKQAKNSSVLRLEKPKGNACFPGHGHPNKISLITSLLLQLQILEPSARKVS